MDKQQKLKTYSITVTVKPKNQGSIKYKAVTSKGVVFAQNPKVANDLAIGRFLESYKDYDGSSITRPKIARENIAVKKCELLNDFIFRQGDNS